MTDPTSAFGGKAKKLAATLTITLPEIDADPQVWQSYNPDEMAKVYKEELESNLIEQLEGPYVNDTMVLDVEVKVV